MQFSKVLVVSIPPYEQLMSWDKTIQGTKFQPLLKVVTQFGCCYYEQNYPYNTSCVPQKYIQKFLI